MPVPTPETKRPSRASVYALSKYDQERICLMIGRAYAFPVGALRFFNVFGTRQALSNSYTGVLAIFASRLLDNKPPLIFEDGLQQRDFVSVYNVARLCRLALEAPEADGRVFDVGSGRSFTIREIAERMAGVMGCEHLPPEITGQYRVGDIRHRFADISAARQVLGYEPRVTLEGCVVEIVSWLEGRVPSARVARDDQISRSRRLFSTYRHFYMGLVREANTPKRSLRLFSDYTPDIGICQWFHFEDHRLEAAVGWLRELSVKRLRTGLGWADSSRPGADEWFDRQMRALEEFDVTLTFYFGGR